MRANATAFTSNRFLAWRSASNGPWHVCGGEQDTAGVNISHALRFFAAGVYPDGNRASISTASW
jgi:hypothetical protein